MEFNYDKDTDSLYINLINKSGVDSFEIAPDFIVDVDENGSILGLEILNVKAKVDFNQFTFNQIPVKNISFINQPELV